ncbi:MAG: hypothetical protein ACR2P3_05215 [Geminicoccaceae bacterium]
MLMNWLERLKEPSSYASIATVLALAGVNLDADLLSAIAQGGAAIAAIVGIFLREKSAG